MPPEQSRLGNGSRRSAHLGIRKTGIRRNRARRGWAIAVILVATSLVTAGGWLGIQLMVNPQALVWINRVLPDWIPIPITGLKPPQTLREIRQELAQTEQLPGEFVPLGSNSSVLDHHSQVSDFVLPILAQQSNCQEHCDKIVELRVYQSTVTQQAQSSQEPSYQLVDQLAIAGPEESFAIAPLVDANSANQGSARNLPLTALKRFEGKLPQPGVWLNLSGQLPRGDQLVAYGQVLYYNPARVRLSPMLEWTSPAGQEPIWQNVTGDETPELVINQTIGLEPQFKIYQVKPIDFLLRPVQLQPISLLDPALKSSVYDNALMLARSGLWSPSSQWLRSLRQQANGKTWSAQAQAQLDLINWHAQITSNQANQSWASPSQQILANLIDGRWAQALQIFEAKPENSQETASLLKGDTGRLQKRVDAVLRINPAQLEVKTWGALLIAAQKGQIAAIAWFKQQSKTTPANMTRLQGLLKRLDGVRSDTDSVATLPTGQIVGSAQLLPHLNPAEWLQPKSSNALKLDSQHRWYLIHVAGFYDGKRWQLSNPGLTFATKPFIDILWKALGLQVDPPLQIIFWRPDGTQQSISGSIKAARVRAGSLELLADAEELPQGTKLAGRPQPLALTESALQWLTPDTLSLADLVQQQPTWAGITMPKLGQILQKEGQLPGASSLTWDALNQRGIGTWLVQHIRLTGSSEPDVVLTISPTMLADLKQHHSVPPRSSAWTRTLIFSATGTVLYNEFAADSDNIHLAIADLGNGSPTLVVDTAKTYRFLRWSAKANRFE